MNDTKEPNDSQETIIEGEVVAQDSPVSQSVEDNSTIITSLDELIKNHINSIDRLQEEQKKLRETLADGFNNDAEFKQLSDKVKEANKEKSVKRAQIMEQSGVIEIANKLKSLNAEVKEKQTSLSDYLLEYQRMTGVNQIEGSDGEVREIIHIAKLVKRLSKGKD